MCRNSIITLVMLLLILGLINLPGSSGLVLCFIKQETCQPLEISCTEGIISQTSAKLYCDSNASRKCTDVCVVNHSTSGNVSSMADHCIGASKCSITHDCRGSFGGVIDINFTCAASTNTLNPTASPPTPSIPDLNTKPSTEGTPSSTDPDITSSIQVTDNRYTTAIVVSVVAPITTVVVVVSIIMYRRGHCKLLAGTCTKRFEKHSAERADAYALSSTANANPTYNFSNDVHLNGCDVDYSEIDKIKKEPDVEYNHLTFINKEAVHEPTYNHIGHFNSSSGNTEQTYDHVDNEMLQKTDLSTLQQDTYVYSHIGAMANPASEQMVEDSYAHINGVMKHPSTSYETNQYDIAFCHLNVGPNGGFRNQERDMKSGREREFNVVGPSKVDSNNEAPVSHSYFILENHEKEA